MAAPTTPEQYIDQFDGETKQRLEQLRAVVRTEAPDAQEGIMYGLIGYKFHKKPLVYFGGFVSHIGFYPTPAGQDAFAEELSRYKTGKGSVQFPLDQPLPLELITQMVRSNKERLEQ